MAPIGYPNMSQVRGQVASALRAKQDYATAESYLSGLLPDRTYAMKEIPPSIETAASVATRVFRTPVPAHKALQSAEPTAAAQVSTDDKKCSCVLL